MTLYLIALALTFILIFWSADRMLLDAVALSRRLHIPPLVIGAVVIGFGTSAPELVVSSTAALKGSLDIAVGNALGSNVTNIALVLGTTALLIGVSAARAGMNRKFGIILAGAVLPGSMLLDGNDLGRGNGALLLAALVVAIYLLVKSEDRSGGMAASDEDEMLEAAGKVRYAGLSLAFYTALLVGASYGAVWAAIHIARELGVAELIIGLTVIALGTSLPELAAALVGAYRKQHSIALGNILGSNLFNSLAVVGLPALLAPAQVSGDVLTRDYPVMLGLTVLLWLLFWLPPRLTLSRTKGLALLACFVAYEWVLYQAALGG